MVPGTWYPGTSSRQHTQHSSQVQNDFDPLQKKIYFTTPQYSPGIWKLRFALGIRESGERWGVIFYQYTVLYRKSNIYKIC